MTLAEILKKKGLTQHTAKKSIAKTPKRKTPRETLIEHLENNLNVISNPSFRVKNRKGELIKPDACFKIDGNFATVWASYSKKRLKLEDDLRLYEIPSEQVKDYLEALLEAAKAGFFDEELKTIQGARSQSQKGTIRKKKSQ